MTKKQLELLDRRKKYRVGERVSGLLGDEMLVFKTSLEEFLVIGAEVSNGNSSKPNGTIYVEVYDFNREDSNVKNAPFLRRSCSVQEEDFEFEDYVEFIREHGGRT